MIIGLFKILLPEVIGLRIPLAGDLEMRVEKLRFKSLLLALGDSRNFGAVLVPLVPI